MAEIKTLAEVEEEHIRKAMKLFKGDKLQVAEALGIGKTTVYRKCEEYKIK